MTIYFDVLESPAGLVWAGVDESGSVVRVEFTGGPEIVPDDMTRHTLVHDEGRLTAVAAQLREYFAGKRRSFDLPLAPAGTAFQQRVWDELKRIPFGETRTYGQIAAAIGSPRACRAVGGANGANPIPVIVPCHRVIGSDGSLTGFGSGLPVKRFLLQLEGVTVKEQD